MIHLLCGLSGSGKSTLTTKLLQEDRTRIVLSPDEYRKALTGREYWEAAESAVFSAVMLTARVMIKHGRSLGPLWTSRWRYLSLPHKKRDSLKLLSGRTRSNLETETNACG